MNDVVLLIMWFSFSVPPMVSPVDVAVALQMNPAEGADLIHVHDNEVLLHIAAEDIAQPCHELVVDRPCPKVPLALGGAPPLVALGALALSNQGQLILRLAYVRTCVSTCWEFVALVSALTQENDKKGRAPTKWNSHTSSHHFTNAPGK